MHQFLDFIQIVLADIVLSGDNALIIGMAAASLSPELRKKAIIYGMVVAAGLRIIFAIFATYLLSIKGLLFLGGVLLLWVSWRLWEEIKLQNAERAAEAQEEENYEGPPRRTMVSALISITVADLSMSIDNVLAVAAIARDNTGLLIFGLLLAIALMGFGATMIVRLLTRYHWISYLGLVVLIITALRMLWDGWPEMAVIVGLA
jgi:YjbE family integral membrane protein